MNEEKIGTIRVDVMTYYLSDTMLHFHQVGFYPYEIRIHDYRDELQFTGSCDNFALTNPLYLIPEYILVIDKGIASVQPVGKEISVEPVVPAPP